jgi:hypothetical protein
MLHRLRSRSHLITTSLEWLLDIERWRRGGLYERRLHGDWSGQHAYPVKPRRHDDATEPCNWTVITSFRVPQPSPHRVVVWPRRRPRTSSSAGLSGADDLAKSWQGRRDKAVASSSGRATPVVRAATRSAAAALPPALRERELWTAHAPYSSARRTWSRRSRSSGASALAWLAAVAQHGAGSPRTTALNTALGALGWQLAVPSAQHDDLPADGTHEPHDARRAAAGAAQDGSSARAALLPRSLIATHAELAQAVATASAACCCSAHGALRLAQHRAGAARELALLPRSSSRDARRQPARRARAQGRRCCCCPAELRGEQPAQAPQAPHRRGTRRRRARARGARERWRRRRA